MRQAQAGRALLDATLVRLALADQFSSVAELLGRLDGGGSPARSARRDAPAGRGGSNHSFLRCRPGGAKKNEPVNAAVPAAPSLPPSRPAPAAAPQAPPAPPVEVPTTAANSPAAVEDDDDDLPRPGKVWEGPSLAELLRSSQPAPAPAPARATSAQATGRVGGRECRSRRPERLAGDMGGAARAARHPTGPRLHGILSHGQLVGIEDGVAVIRYGAQHDTFVKMLERNGKKDAVRDAMTRLLNQSVGVRFEVAAEAASPAPAATPAPPQNGTPPPPRRPGAPAGEAPPPPSAPAAPGRA